jgi:hypothetical protein
VAGGDVAYGWRAPDRFSSAATSCPGSEAQVETTRNTIADRVLLQDRARVGDVQTSHLTNRAGSTRTSTGSHPPCRLAAARAGFARDSAACGERVLHSGGFSGSYGRRVRWLSRRIAIKGGGVSHWRCSVDNGARSEALRRYRCGLRAVWGLRRVWIGAASGVTLAAGDLRIEVSGENRAAAR